MDASRWRRIKEVFAAVVELPSALREAWLSTALPDDPDLAAEVLELAAAHDERGAIFELGALAATPDLELQTAALGLRIGPYRVLAELGRGGMGAVYLAARDDDAFEQKVALKLVKRGMDTDEIVRRFVHERQILAGLAHPNVARLLDGGSTADGRPYFVMEHVEGEPITRFVARQGLGLAARLRLFLKVCAAVQYAHQNLVIHRDLKPANILVGPDGEPKLLDFGIAKLLAADGLGALSGLTDARQRPMTPDYASPEQREGRPVTTATDVHGLGLLLYELLVGRGPRALAQASGADWASRPPSQAVLALGNDPEAKRASRALRGDLDAIVGKAIAAEPERRYPTAAALAADVLRHLDQRPIEARRPTLAYRLGRTVRRHRLASGLVAAIALLAAAATYQAIEVARQRDRAEAQRQQAVALADFLKNLFRSVDPDESRGNLTSARQILDRGAASLMAAANGQTDPATRAALLQEIGAVYFGFGAYPDADRLLAEARRLRCADGDSGNEAENQLACAETLALLGNVALSVGRYAEARSLFERALDLDRRLLPPGHGAIADALNGLGRTAAEEGKGEEARSRLREALAIGSATSPPDPKRTATSQIHLGYLAAVEGDSAEAALRARLALDLASRGLGEDHPLTVLARNELAASLVDQGDFPHAEALFREILTSYRRILGDEHPDIALTLNNLGTVLEVQGRLAEAEAAFREALDLRQRMRLPPDSYEVNLLSSYGAVLRQQGKLDAAATAFERARAEAAGIEGEKTALLANVLRGLAQVRAEQNDLAAAEALARQSLGLLTDGTPNSGEAAPSWLLLADILGEKRDLAAAEAAYRHGLELTRGRFPAGHPRLATPLVGLGTVLVERGRAGEALPLLVEGLQILRASKRPGDPKIAIAESGLGACLAALGRGAEARPLLAGSYQALLQRLGPDHRDTRRAAARLHAVGGPLAGARD